MTDERDSISENPQRKFPTANTERPCLNRQITSARDRLVCHPSGMKNDHSFVSGSGGVAFAQPPANLCYPSGIKTNFAGSERKSESQRPHRERGQKNITQRRFFNR